MRNYPFGKTGTVFVYSMATGAFLRYEDGRGVTASAIDQTDQLARRAEVTIDTDSARREAQAREALRAERLNSLGLAERQYEG